MKRYRATILIPIYRKTKAGWKFVKNSHATVADTKAPSANYLLAAILKVNPLITHYAAKGHEFGMIIREINLRRGKKKADG